MEKEQITRQYSVSSPSRANSLSFGSGNGQGAFELHGHNLKRCDSFRLTIGSETNKDVSGINNSQTQKKCDGQGEYEKTCNKSGLSLPIVEEGLL